MTAVTEAVGRHQLARKGAKAAALRRKQGDTEDWCNGSTAVQKTDMEVSDGLLGVRVLHLPPYKGLVQW